MAGRDKPTADGGKLEKRLKELRKLQVRIGFQRGKGKSGGADIADVAMWNELGTENMPARPFMRQSVEKNRDRIKAACAQALKDVLLGKTTAEAALRKLGAMQKALVQNEIKSGGFAPNAEPTKKKKGSDKPLVDTGRMRQSVSVEIAEKGGG